MKSSLLGLMFLSLIVPSAVTESVKKDDISLQDCRVWYTVYKGAYLYVKEYDAVGSKDFGDIFDKMRLIRDKALPEKGNENFVLATNLSKYETVEYTPENRTDLAEDLFNISEGIKKFMEDSSK
jgi:hypothetical protein